MDSNGSDIENEANGNRNLPQDHIIPAGENEAEDMQNNLDNNYHESDDDNNYSADYEDAGGGFSTNGSDESEGEIVIDEINLVDPEHNEEIVEISQLREWAKNPAIPNTSVTELLKILKPRLLPQLPTTAASFLRMSHHFNIRTIEKTFDTLIQFVYFGISRGLKNCINPDFHPDRTIAICINIDGARLFKSSMLEMWPILCRIFCERHDIYLPFPIANSLFMWEPKNHEI